MQLLLHTPGGGYNFNLSWLTEDQPLKSSNVLTRENSPGAKTVLNLISKSIENHQRNPMSINFFIWPNYRGWLFLITFLTDATLNVEPEHLKPFPFPHLLITGNFPVILLFLPSYKYEINLVNLPVLQSEYFYKISIKYPVWQVLIDRYKETLSSSPVVPSPSLFNIYHTDYLGKSLKT